MASSDMITLRNKRTGELITVPRSQFVQEPQTQVPEEKGFRGIMNQVVSSAKTAPKAIEDMLLSIPGGIENVKNYVTQNNPVSSAANLGAGAVESGAALLSSPQILMRYLSDKFPRFGEAMQRGAMPGSKGINEPTFYEGLNRFENEHGMAPQSEEEASVRNAGGLLFGGGALKKIGSALARTGAITAEQAGRGGDPVHAAILGMLGESINKVGQTKPVRAIPGATVDAVKSIPDVAKRMPEFAGRAAASGLETTADLASQIPVAGKVISPIAQPTLGALASYLKHISVAPEELAKRNLFGDIDPADVPGMEKMSEAAKRLNLDYVTPSELLQSPFESVKQANVGRTTKGMKELYKKGEGREGSEEGAINKLFDLIHEDKLDPIKKAAYEQTMQNSVPPEFIEKQSARPVIKKAMKAVENNTAYKQMLEEEYGIDPDGVAKNSFMYWDMVKRVLGDMEEKVGRKGGKTESSVYGDTRRSMVSEMDKIEPQYKTARSIAERGFTRKKLEDVFDKKDRTFNNFDAFLKSKKNLKDVMAKLESFPEAKQQMEDIKLFSGKMIPNNPTVRAAAALKRTGMSDARNALEAKKREFDERYGQEHDLAAVNLMTNPDLMAVLKQYLNKK